MTIDRTGRRGGLQHARLVGLAAAATIVLSGCTAADRSLPDDVRLQADSAIRDERAVEQCEAVFPVLEDSTLEAAWDGSLTEAVTLAEQFDSRNSGPRESLSRVDAETYVAFCVYSGQRWGEMTPSDDGRLLVYAATEAPLSGDPTLVTALNGVIAYF
jgi:hypothetical protein